jgi:GT2 family glycosyltransferase
MLCGVAAVGSTVSVLVPAERRHTNLLRASIPPLFDAETPLEVVLVHAGPRGTAPEVDPRARVVEAGAGAGFCRAINAGISATGGELVLFSNADLFAPGSYVDELARFLARRPAVACAGGKLLRYDLATARATRAVDSTGLVVGRSRRSWDRGEGEPDVGLYDEEEEMFGLSGAGLLIRREALESARVAGEYLDETFVAYKDDVDLAWRLRRLGLSCWYVPSAVAHHARTSRGRGGRPYGAAPLAYLRSEAEKPAYVRRRSLANQWLLLAKNEEAADFLRDAPWILGRETAGLAYRAATTPGTLSAVAGALRLLPTAVRKRSELSRRSVAAPGELRRRWFRTGSRPRSSRA